MKTKNCFIFLLIAVMGLTACVKSVENPAVVAKNTQKKEAGAPTDVNSFNLIDTVVYVSGEVTDTPTNSTNAVYWKNGVMKQLSSSGTNVFATTTGIVVNGTNVYVSGYYATEAGVTGVYWVNGVEKRLPDHTIANAIAVNSVTGSVYIAGDIINAAGSHQAALWQDGVETPLTTASNTSNANGIFLSGTDVYIAGDINFSAVYWKNGVATSLSPGLSGTARSVFYDGTDVYTAGRVNPEPFTTAATFWKNGLTKLLTGAPNHAEAYAIAVGESNAFITHTYVVGYNIAVADVAGAYWQDGVLKTIAGSSGLNAVTLLGNDVYIAGFADGAAYWKNGVMKKLAHNGEVSGIQVVAARKPVPVIGRQ
ncbi:hypothetical protein ACFGVR_00690 [Mucilaginibacter sp. AW1-3]